MQKLILDTPINANSSTTFRGGFSSHDDIWQFLNTTLPQSLYFETWYDLQNTSTDDLGYIQYQNKVSLIQKWLKGQL